MAPGNDAPCDGACDGGFDPFAWLARLFEGGTAGGEKTAASGPVRLLPAEAPAAHPGGPAPADPAPGPAGTAPFPAEPGAPELHAGGEDPRDADLRTDEVVARIWIAPFVDAEGVYREASYVRVVLEPAGWRLAR